MPTFHEAVGAVETFSPAQELFNRRRRTAGLFLAPTVFLILLFAPFDLPVLAHRMAAIMGLVAVSQAAGVRPIEPVLGATLGASMGFMMPVSTAPNATVYSSGYADRTDDAARPVPRGRVCDHRLDGNDARTDLFLITMTARTCADFSIRGRTP